MDECFRLSFFLIFYFDAVRYEEMLITSGGHDFGAEMFKLRARQL